MTVELVETSVVDVTVVETIGGGVVSMVGIAAKNTILLLLRAYNLRKIDLSHDPL